MLLPAPVRDPPTSCPVLHWRGFLLTTTSSCMRPAAPPPPQHRPSCSVRVPLIGADLASVDGRHWRLPRRASCLWPALSACFPRHRAARSQPSGPRKPKPMRVARSAGGATTARRAHLKGRARGRTPLGVRRPRRRAVGQGRRGGVAQEDPPDGRLHMPTQLPAPDYRWGIWLEAPRPAAQFADRRGHACTCPEWPAMVRAQ